MPKVTGTKDSIKMQFTRSKQTRACVVSFTGSGVGTSEYTEHRRVVWKAHEL